MSLFSKTMSEKDQRKEFDEKVIGLDQVYKWVNKYYLLAWSIIKKHRALIITASLILMILIVGALGLWLSNERDKLSSEKMGLQQEIAILNTQISILDTYRPTNLDNFEKVDLLGVECASIDYNDMLLTEIEWNGITIFIPQNLKAYKTSFLPDKVQIWDKDIVFLLEFRVCNDDYETYLFNEIANLHEQLDLDSSKIILESYEPDRAFVQIRYNNNGFDLGKYYAIISVKNTTCLYLEFQYPGDIETERLDVMLMALKANVTRRFL